MCPLKRENYNIPGFTLLKINSHRKISCRFHNPAHLLYEGALYILVLAHVIFDDNGMLYPVSPLRSKLRHSFGQPESKYRKNLPKFVMLDGELWKV